MTSHKSVSALYDDAYTWAANGKSQTSTKFFYPSAMVTGNPSVTLDRSAANTFANAKHCASGKSGRRKLVTIMEAHQKIGGEGATNAVKDIGRGFKSSNVFDLGRDE